MSHAAAHEGFGAKPYRAYVLGALVVVYTFNFIDRQLIGVVQEAIKEDFLRNGIVVSDFMLGILGGPAFAILYTAAGIPIARLAERANRISIVAAGLAVWSAMTALCGFAGNYWHLLLARIGVGIGEAACTPPAHSALSDYFPTKRRATALAIYSLGIPIGTMFAAIGGGWLVQHFDWRTAFLMLGAPGLVLAVIVKLTVREPPRPDTGHTGASAETPSLGETVRTLASKASFWHTAFAGALMAFVGYGTAQFLVSHFVRNYEIGANLQQEIAHGSYAFGVIGGLAVGAGTFLGGFLGDRLQDKRPRVLSWLPALGCALAIPVYIASLMQSSFALGFTLLLIAPVFHYLYLGPMFAVAQGVAPPRMRATSAAILILVVNLIGYGLGPPFVGAVADYVAAGRLAEIGIARSACAEGAFPAECAAAGATGLRYALCAAVLFLAWAGLHFLLAGRTLQRDRVS